MGLIVVVVGVAGFALGRPARQTLGGRTAAEAGAKGVPGFTDPTSLADPEGLLVAGGQFAASEVSTPAGKPAMVTYTIQSGDTIWDLAAKFGTTVDSIIGSNNLSSSGRIGPGQTIKIPTAPGLAVTVRSGQTLWDLAKGYGLKVEDIAKANNLDANAALAVGTELFLPGAKAQPVVVASRGTGRSPMTSGSSGSGFIWPVRGSITSYFGPRNGRIHTGIDIAVGYGSPVHASRSGTISRAGWISGYGYAVIIDHGGGVSSLYAHNSRLLVKEGQEVSQGDVIAYSGSSGHSTGPHVHFEIRLNWQPVNPLARLD